MKSVLVPLAAGLLLLLSGCQHRPIPIADYSGERHVTPDDRVYIHLLDTDRSRIDPYEGKQVITGPIWADVFIGRANAPASLRVIDAHMEERPAIVGITIRATYSAVCVLTYRGREYMIRSTASRTAGLKLFSAMRQAAELTAVDVARQAEQIIAKADAALGQ